MSALRASLATSVAQIFKILLGFITIKLIALSLGPDGFGRIGHFMSLVTFVTVFAGGGILNGVVRYTAELRDRPVNLQKFISTAFLYSFVCSVIMLVIGSAFSVLIASYIFNDKNLWLVIVTLFVAQLIIGLNQVLIGFVNGKQLTGVFAIISLLGCLVATPVVVLLILKGGFNGAALSLIVAPLLIGLPSWYLVFTEGRAGKWKLRFELFYIKKLSHYSGMVIFSAVALPMSEIFVRSLIVDRFGFGAAGVWQGSIKISAVYLSFFSIFLAYYFMPQISRIRGSHLERSVIRYLTLVLTIFSVSALLAYALRVHIISSVLSVEFLSLSELIHLQLIGDLFKVSGYVMGFLIVARGATFLYVLAELIQSVGLILIGSISIEWTNNLSGIFYAQIITNFLYCIFGILCFLFFFRKET